MDKAKDDAYFEAKIRKDLAFAIDAIDGLSAEEFNENELVSDAICFRFIQKSEEASGLSESYVSSHREVPWKK
ncbi:MAG: hypothetical protein LKG11_07390 [Bacilli bacterium]|jgi:uncharacterized protein with HEPN domain|nr:hypothetical protein [Bacilli bacterium]